MTPPLKSILLVLPLAMAGCGLSQPPASREVAVQDGCRAQADRIYAAQNRYQLSERDPTATPFSANTLPSNPSAGLADRYRHSELVSDCLNQQTGPAARPAP